MEKKEKKKYKKTGRKNYYSPKLVIYGDIRKITQGPNLTGKKDSVGPTYS
jgi:hypothetical protein